LHPIDIRLARGTDQFNFQLAKAYWLQTIQPYIVGRQLRGAEGYIALQQHAILKGAADSAQRENETEKGRRQPIPAEAFPDWEKLKFKPPELLCADNDLKPEVLAGIAAPLLKTGMAIQTPRDAVQIAYELWLAADQFINHLPKRPRIQAETFFGFEFEKVTFAEILQSSEKGSGRMPLLPPVQKERNEGRLTPNALKMAVKRFLKEHEPRMTKEEFQREEAQAEEIFQKGRAICEKDQRKPKMFRIGSGKKLTYEEWQELNQDSIHDIFNHQRISVHLLAEIRWERFKNYNLNQQKRTKSRHSG